MDEYETIRYEVTDGVATLTLNRPDRMNGMTYAMLRETYHVLKSAAADPSLRILVLTGAGKAFCPGADLGHATTPGGAAERQDRSPLYFHVPVLLHEMPALTIAAVNGACAGAGLGWACACDLRVAAKSAMFNTAFLNVAVAGDMGLPWSLPRLVGGAKARELSFLSGKFPAEEAHRIGLVARTFDDETFRDEVDALVGRLVAMSPVALKTMKAHYVAAEKLPFAELVDVESERHLRISASEDTKEAFKAFLEKRPPVFVGR